MRGACFRIWLITFLAVIRWPGLDPETDLFFRRDQFVVLVNGGAPEAGIGVQDEGGKIGGSLPNLLDALLYDILYNDTPIYRTYSG